MTKKLILTALIASLATAGAIGATGAFAASSTTSSSPSLVQMIASKFGLNTSDVQKVFDQYRQDRHAKMETNYESRLTDLVSQGKITDAQKSLIIAEHQKLETEHQGDLANLGNLSSAERQAKLQAIRQEVTTWAQQNGIDPRYLMPSVGLHRLGVF